MSTNIATILVGLGYDLSALEKGAPDAFRLINQQTLGMSSEMKRSSREGAESLRLIDEALGIHISRPLTRILTQEFPGFASALQSILGVGAAGAIAAAGFEFFDKIASSIEKATKAQDALRDATANVDKVFAEEMAAYKDKDKAITASTAAVDKLAEAEMKQIQAAEAASGAWTRALAAIGGFAHEASSLQSTLNVEAIDKQLSTFLENYNKAALEDSIKGTANAAKMLTDELANANKLVDQLTEKRGIEQSYRSIPLAGIPLGTFLPGQGTSQSEIDAAQHLVEALNKLKQVQDTTRSGVNDEQARADALERQANAAKALADLYRSIGDSMKKLEPQTDPLKKLESEIDQMRYKAESDFRELGRNTDDALQLTAARAALRDYETNLDRVLAKAKADAAITEAMKNLPSTIARTGTAPTFGASSVLPVLGAGGTTAAQFDQFLKDTNAQLKLAAQAYQDVITPEQKYELAQKELGALLHSGVISWTAYTAAVQKAQEEMNQAADRMEKLLEKGGVAGGFQAFWMKLQGGGSGEASGQQTFNVLNTAMQGFVDQTAQALTGAKAHWQQFFESLDQMVLKLLLNRVFASLLTGPLGGLGSIFGLGGGTTTGASGLNAFSFAGAFTGFASGTDYAPGGLSWVGENGPELLNLPTGSSVTPAGMLRGGGAPVIHIDARGAELGVEEKIARALSEWTPHVVTRAVAETSEVQRRGLSS